LRFFSTLSVPIDIMIPPKSHEVRFLSHSNPVPVNIAGLDKNDTVLQEVMGFYNGLMSCMQGKTIAFLFYLVFLF
jgi:hypothetical protein